MDEDLPPQPIRHPARKVASANSHRSLLASAQRWPDCLSRRSIGRAIMFCGTTRSAFDGERIDKITRDLSLYLRQAGPDYAKDQAAKTWLDRDLWGEGDALW